jgi:hypothetical protein
MPTIGAPAAAFPLMVSGAELAAELEVMELLETELLELELTTLDAWLETLEELLETTVLDELLETAVLLTDEAVLVGGVSGDFEPPPPPQPLKASAKTRMLFGIKREVDSNFMIPSTH